jgi:hypothetical protein
MSFRPNLIACTLRLQACVETNRDLVLAARAVEPGRRPVRKHQDDAFRVGPLWERVSAMKNREPAPTNTPSPSTVVQNIEGFHQGNGAEAPPRVVVENTAAGHQVRDDKAVLDEFEQLASDTILDDGDGDEPGAKDEVSTPLVLRKLPRFAIFRANPRTFDLWGTPDDQGMDQLVYVTTKTFAPHLEEDVDLRRVRFFETVTTDRIVRLIYCFLPEKTGRSPNIWQTSKLAALEMAQSRWTTMRSRTKLQQYTFRPASKDYGEPKFSGLTPAQHVVELKKMGLLVDNKDHPFYRKATDSEE